MRISKAANQRIGGSASTASQALRGKRVRSLRVPRGSAGTRFLTFTTAAFALAAAVIALAACGGPAPVPAPTATPTASAPETSTLAGPEDTETVLPPPYIVVTEVLLADPSGFPGAPIVSGDGTIYTTGLHGRLAALTPSGEVLWDNQLADKSAGSPLLTGDRLYALDRTGLNAFTTGGAPLWRFEHPAGTALAGPVAGPDGTLYYTLQSGSQGHIQAVTTAGEPLWLARVTTHSYYRPPLPTPNGQFVLFNSEVFSTIDGAPVDLGLNFEPEAFYVGADRRVYLMHEGTLTAWSYAGGRAVLDEERVISPHELGFPVQVGILENGEVVFVYPTAVAWFTPAGRMLQLARVEKGYFTHLITGPVDGLQIVCGRSLSDLRENGLPNCAAFSLDYEQALWNSLVALKVDEFTGGVFLPDGTVAVALEDGILVHITYHPEAP